MAHILVTKPHPRTFEPLPTCADRGGHLGRVDHIGDPRSVGCGGDGFEPFEPAILWNYQPRDLKIFVAQSHMINTERFFSPLGSGFESG